MALAVLSNAIPFAQATADRFWLAFRYDTSEVLIYFGAVKFGSTTVNGSVKIPAPIITHFPFPPIGLASGHVRRFQTARGAERFSIGDQYDLLLGNGRVSSVTLTRYVGFLSDEEVGNESYIGALARVPEADRPFLRGYQAVTRHQDDLGASTAPAGASATPFAALAGTPADGRTTARVVADVRARIGRVTTSQLRPMALRGPATLESIQQFRTVGGAVRFLVSVTFDGCRAVALLGESPTPAFAVDEYAYDRCDRAESGQPPRLVNVIDLGRTRTGLIVDQRGVAGLAISLVEYRDGRPLSKLPVLQLLAVGE